MSSNRQPSLSNTLRQLVRHFPLYVRLTRRLVEDDRLSTMHKAPLFGAIGYGLSPIDLVPGFVPVFGQLDDMVVLLASLRLTLDRIPPVIANEHLMSVGLLKADIDDDIANCGRAAERIVSGTVRGAATVVEVGTRMSLRLATSGYRAFRDR